MRLILILLLTYGITSDGSKNQTSLVFSKLEGQWQRIGKPENFESWEKGKKNSLVGENYRVVEGKKVILETLSIESKDGSWYYIPDVPHNPAPVPFIMTKVGENSFHSQNPDHDFPKWIRYKLTNSDSLTVTIGDEKDTVAFRFIRYE